MMKQPSRKPFSIKWNNIDSEFSSVNHSELLGDSVQATSVPQIRCIKQMNTQANVSYRDFPKSGSPKVF